MAIELQHQTNKIQPRTPDMKKTTTLLIPAIALLSGSLCSAAVYNVKYLASGQTAVPVSSLQGVLGSTGESWNQANGSYTNLIDSTGASSTINVSGLSGGTDEGPATSIFTGNSNQFGKGDNQTISFSGLTFGGTYNIYIYALSHNTGSWGNTADTERAAGAFTTTNTTTNGTSQPLDNGITGTGSTTFTAGSNYVLFQSIVADGTGNISIVADAKDGAGATRLHINGLQIESIPETSSAALLGLGAFALILRRRK
jgi:hypothetical protein